MTLLNGPDAEFVEFIQCMREPQLVSRSMNKAAGDHHHRNKIYGFSESQNPSVDSSLTGEP